MVSREELEKMKKEVAILRSEVALEREIQALREEKKGLLKGKSKAGKATQAAKNILGKVGDGFIALGNLAADTPVAKGSKKQKDEFTSPLFEMAKNDKKKKDLFL